MSTVAQFLRFGVVAVFLSGGLFFTSCTTPPEGNSLEGKRWFGLQRCDGCHGPDGSGGKAPDIRQQDFDYRSLLSKVRNPKSAIMPSYSPEQLSDQKVADIFSYLQEKK